MTECCECGCETDGEAAVCEECAMRNVVDEARQGGSPVEEWAECPLCGGSGRCFFCSPGGPCYHCSGSGHVEPGSAAECHICGGHGNLDKGCEMCNYTRRCTHCDATGRVPSSVLRS